METITIECPNCKKKYTLPAEKIPRQQGVKLNCKNCGFSFPFSSPKGEDNFSESDSTIIGHAFVKEGDLVLTEFPKDCEIILTYKEKGVEVKKIIDKPLTIIGRAEGDIIIADPLVSKKHACIEVKSPTMIVLKDLASRNGTFHNGMKVSSVHLQSGDIIKIGNVEITFSSSIKFL